MQWKDKDHNREESPGSAGLAHACRSLSRRGGAGKGQSMQKGNTRRKTEQGGVRDTDSLCLRCGGTVRGVPWKEPCQGEKEGAEYPPCVERDGAGRYNKKGN